MKRGILALVLSLCMQSNMHAQTVNGVLVKDINVEYVKIVGVGKVFSNKLTILLDYGQEIKVFEDDKYAMIKDVNGKEMIFNSMIDALNFMSKNGYDFVQAYGITDSSGTVPHYLLRKRNKS